MIATVAVGTDGSGTAEKAVDEQTCSSGSPASTTPTCS
jgi:hypothetical protein